MSVKVIMEIVSKTVLMVLVLIIVPVILDIYCTVIDTNV